MSSNIKLESVDITSDHTLDDFHSLTQPTGSLDKASTNNMRGLGHTKVLSIIPDNKETKGYVFFTRPQLNMSSINLMHMRKMYSLLTENPASVQRYTRCMLDPRLMLPGKKQLRCPLVDNNLGFIPILTNTVKSVSGWPDINLSTFTSKQGIRKEQYLQADGMIDILDSFDLDCTFKNTKDEPIVMMLQTWLLYMASVFEGTLSPYMDMITNNELDYNTRIYRLVMNETGTHVTKIACTGASMPVSAPMGKMYDYSSGTPFLDQNKDINIRFRCVGAMYNDDITTVDFNAVSIIFNPTLGDVVRSGFTPLKGHTYDKIPAQLATQFNHRGHPLIDTNTLELTWWVDTNSLTWKNIIKTNPEDILNGFN